MKIVTKIPFPEANCVWIGAAAPPYKMGGAGVLLAMNVTPTGDTQVKDVVGPPYVPWPIGVWPARGPWGPGGLVTVPAEGLYLSTLRRD